MLAAPIRRGRALARQRVAGVVFLVVLALLVELTVALYQKKFTPTVDVSLKTDRIGNQLSDHADVKLRGILVGEVRHIRSKGDGATLELALKPDMAASIPADVKAQILPKTLFGEKEVDLISTTVTPAVHIKDGATIPQDSSTTALETEKALNDLLPLLQSLQPQDLSRTLNALSTALRGRGDELGQNFALNAAYLKRLNPALPQLARDMQGVADFANNTADATPQFLTTLDNLSANSRNLVEEQAQLDTFLRTTSTFSNNAQDVISRNAQGFIDLARDSVPSLQLFAKYSPNFACFLNRVSASEAPLEQSFGGDVPGLHITFEAVQDEGAFVAGDEPKNKEKRTAGCYGLGSTPIIPFPDYANSQDGYRDSDPAEDPGTGPKGFPQNPQADNTASLSAAAIVQSFVLDQNSVSRTFAAPKGMTQLGAMLSTPLA